MRKAPESLKIFSERRKILAEKLKGSALILAAHPEHVRNHDVFFPYRADSNMYYLTGFEEPECIFLFRPGMVPETVMFVRRKDRERETWDGFRFGVDGVAENFGIEKAFAIDEFEKEAPNLLKSVDSVHYRLFKNSEMDRKIESALISTKSLQGRTGYGLLTIHDPDPLIGEMRLIKSEHEIDHLRKACEITSIGHLNAMKQMKAGLSERQIQGILSHSFYMHGAAREGYNYIVASGSNATTLHYNFNDQECKSGDLLLVDAGAEYAYLTGDVTRTYPINGKFTEAQREVYESVLGVQKKILEILRPGITFKELHDLGADLLTEAMLDLGLLEGRKEDILAANKHRRYYPHGIGHWLGMDVHDAGLYFINGSPRAIEANMCFTIEPGIYIPIDDENAPKKYRGIGIRIEDNVRITPNGCENMTLLAPKEIVDLEKIIGSEKN